MTASAVKPGAALPPGDGAGQRAPVVVLAHAHSGMTRLQELLAGRAGLACTSGTGVLPLCDQAAAAWRQIDNRDGTLSPVAIASIRALVSSMITAILAGTGERRWCEISFSPPTGAEAFLRLYPGAKFVCLHRSCPDVIRAGIQANPWGLAGATVGRFAAAYPGSSAAAVAAYWAWHTGPVLDFAAAHPAACCRVRSEDLADDPGQETRRICEFLDLPWTVGAAPVWADENTASARSAGPLADRGQVPAGQIPPQLRAQVNDLQARIGYPPIT